MLAQKNRAFGRGFFHVRITDLLRQMREQNYANHLQYVGLLYRSWATFHIDLHTALCHHFRDGSGGRKPVGEMGTRCGSN